MEPQNNYQQNTISSILIRCLALVLVYSGIVFFCFDYRSAPVLGIDGFTLTSLNLSTYIFYLIICLGLAIWMSKSPDFIRQLWKLSKIILAIVAILSFIPAGFGTLGMMLWGQTVMLAILFTVSIGVYISTKKLLQLNRIIAAIIGTLLFIALVPIIYADGNDLLVKQKLLTGNHLFGLNNSYDYVFVSIDECDGYIYNVRKNACRNDKMAHDVASAELEQEKFLSSNINLVVKQGLSDGSENYPNFPPQNISDVKIGMGDVAKYGDKVVLNILSANVDGKTYDNLINYDHILPKPFENIQGVLSLESIRGDDFKSYLLGVIGMKIGGVRKITFKSVTGYWLESDVSVKGGQSATFTIELVSIAK